MKKLSLAAAIALAANTSFADSEELTIVTATRSEQNLSEVLASAALIDKEELQLQQHTDLSSAFANQVSLDIVRSGGPGAPASVLTRGANSNHTLFLVNGMRISSATLGSTAFQFIDPALIQRIEIVRGSHSTLYGSEAIGGVVQVFTAPESDELEHQVSAEVGSFNTRKLSASSQGAFGGFHYSVGLSHNETDGIDRLVDDTANNADDDAYENTGVQAFFGYEFANQFQLNFSHLQNDARTEYDSTWAPASDPFDESKISATQAAFIAPFSDLYEMQLSVGQSSDDSENHDDSLAGETLTSAFTTTRQSLLWQNDLNFSDLAHLTLGLDFVEAEVQAESYGFETVYADENGDQVKDVSNTALFSQWQGSAAAINWKIGTRVDDHDTFGSHNTSSIALGVDIEGGYRFFSSWSEGFKAPTFNDLYFPASAFSAGNPDLVPEQSENFEFGVRSSSTNLSWEALVYHNKVENLIEWAAGDDFVWRPTNIANAKLKGAEFNTLWSFGNASLEFGASYNATENTDTGEDLVNRSRQKYFVEFTHEIASIHYGINLRHQGKRGTGESAIDSHLLANAFATWDLNDQISLYSRIENLFDEEYSLNQGYNEEGFKAKLGVRFSF